MSYNTLDKKTVLEKLSQGAIIEFSPMFGVANLSFEGSIIGRVHLSTFGSLCLRNLIQKTKSEAHIDTYEPVAKKEGQ